jgi:hypothetical protein
MTLGTCMHSKCLLLARICRDDVGGRGTTSARRRQNLTRLSRVPTWNDVGEWDGFAAPAEEGGGAPSSVRGFRSEKISPRTIRGAGGRAGGSTQRARGGWA